MNKSKRKIFLKLGLVVLVSASIILFAIMAGIRGENILQSISVVAIALIMLAGFIIFGVRQLKGVKAGLPVEDEHSRKVMTRATAQSFFISLYWLLALMWLSDYRPDMPAHAALGVGIGGMAIIFFVCWVWYNKKGDV